jgi:hypothetical protein
MILNWVLRNEYLGGWESCPLVSIFAVSGSVARELVNPQLVCCLALIKHNEYCMDQFGIFVMTIFFLFSSL